MVFQNDYFQTVCEYSIDQLRLRQPGRRRRGSLRRGSPGRGRAAAEQLVAARQKPKYWMAD